MKYFFQSILLNSFKGCDNSESIMLQHQGWSPIKAVTILCIKMIWWDGSKVIPNGKWSGRFGKSSRGLIGHNLRIRRRNHHIHPIRLLHDPSGGWRRDWARVRPGWRPRQHRWERDRSKSSSFSTEKNKGFQLFFALQYRHRKTCRIRRIVKDLSD